MVNTSRASQNSISSNFSRNTRAPSTRTSPIHHITQIQIVPDATTETDYQNFILNNKDINSINNSIERHLIDTSLNNIYHEKTIRIPDFLTNKLEYFCGIMSREIRGPFVNSVIDAANSLDYNQIEKFIECDSFLRAQHFLDNPHKYRKEILDNKEYIHNIKRMKAQFNFISMRINNYTSGIPIGSIILALVAIGLTFLFISWRNYGDKWDINNANVITAGVATIISSAAYVGNFTVNQRDKNNDEMFKIARNIFIKRKEGMDILTSNNFSRDKFKLKNNITPTIP
ncbi:hypothetical protein [Brucella oryzae]|nr:hypothetical protein [Brucella oryzae]